MTTIRRLTHRYFDAALTMNEAAMRQLEHEITNHLVKRFGNDRGFAIATEIANAAESLEQLAGLLIEEAAELNARLERNEWTQYTSPED